MKHRRTSELRFSPIATDDHGKGCSLDDGSFVYVVQIGDDGPVKIGYADHDPINRIRSLQTSVPYPLTVRAIIGFADRGVETRLHNMFADLRMKGEWFNPTSRDFWVVIEQLPYQLDLREFTPPSAKKNIGARLNIAEAEAIWRDAALTTAQALDRMPGWTRGGAQSQFGMRGVGRAMTSSEASRRGKLSGVLTTENSVATLLRTTHASELRMIVALWKSRAYPTREARAEAINEMLAAKGLRRLGAQITIWRALKELQAI